MKLPQLSVRDLFWLVLVVGMGVGWWADHRTQDGVAVLYRSRYEQLKIQMMKQDERERILIDALEQETAKNRSAHSP